MASAIDQLRKEFSEGYVILRSNSSLELQRLVNKWLIRGFTLVGGLVVSSSGEHVEEYLQAVYKEPSKPPRSKATGDN